MRRTIAMAISLTDGTVPQFIGRQSQGPEGVDRAPHERPLPLRVTWSRGSKWRSERSGLRPTRLGRLFAHSLHRRVCVWPKLKRVSARLSDENGPTILALCTRCSDSVLAFGSGWPRSMLWRVERWGSDSYHCRHQASEGREGHDTERSLFIACNELRMASVCRDLPMRRTRRLSSIFCRTSSQCRAKWSRCTQSHRPRVSTSPTRLAPGSFSSRVARPARDAAAS